ncbi:MAG TPA: DUF4331 domain-containing protein [Verrucomicrobiae bacterium]|jgi:hypothetical protein|nr:DUF4331 domain-containing protein [Verrucomicrobiae bacterium]
MKVNYKVLISTGVAAAAWLLAGSVRASSHMDAPLITLDPAANTTDVYAFVARGDDPADTNNYLVVALGVYPFEEPGIGPNAYNFDPNVLYQIHICTTNKNRGLSRAALNDVEAGRATFSYQFNFTTTYQAQNTILQSYLGVISNVGDASQNLIQTYNVTKLDHRNNRSTVLFRGNLVPPNNEGIATPLYNQGNDGNNPAKGGVADPAVLDPYTRQAIYTNDGYEAFAGQRDDGFYGDVLGVFDLLNFTGKDAQKGFNIHLIALRIPLSELGNDRQQIGVYATTSRRAITGLRSGASYSLAVEERRNPLAPGPRDAANAYAGGWVQVARQGNPLFNEVLVAIADKDLYSRSAPTSDRSLFDKYALNPEPAALVDNILLHTTNADLETGRTDLEGIFIPDLIKVDLSTGPARLQGGGLFYNDQGYNSLSVFGGDTLTSTINTNAPTTVAGGWPNGRRFGDNVVGIALTAIMKASAHPMDGGVTANDILYNKVFPYEATPQNGRNHTHE